MSILHCPQVKSFFTSLSKGIDLHLGDKANQTTPDSPLELVCSLCKCIVVWVSFVYVVDAKPKKRHLFSFAELFFPKALRRRYFIVPYRESFYLSFHLSFKGIDLHLGDKVNVSSSGFPLQVAKFVVAKAMYCRLSFHREVCEAKAAKASS